MVVIAQRPGQLGNQLFVFAHFIAWSIDRGAVLSNPAFFDVADLFPSTQRDLFCRYPPKRSLLPAKPILRRLLYWLCVRSASVFGRLRGPGRLIKVLRVGWHEIYPLRSRSFEETIRSTHVVLTQGWLFEDNTGLITHADEIRRFFQPLPSTQRNVDRLLRDARRDVDLLIGVHLRRGDYNRFLGGKYLLSSDEYKEVVRRTKELFPERKIRFLLCSNEEIDRRSWEEELDCTFGTGVAVEDMYALSGCDYIVGPPSTFTIWASYYGSVPLFMITDRRPPTSTDEFVVRMSQTTFPEIQELKEKHLLGKAPTRSPWLG